MDPYNYPHMRSLENNAESRRTKTKSYYSRQLNSKGNSKRGGPPAPPTATDPNSLTSFFELELSTMDGNPTEDDIANALHIFVTSYNDLKASSFNDPLERNMVATEVEYISHARRRRTLEEDDAARQLQNLNVLLFLRVSGTCNGCQSNPFFTNQVVGRKKRQRRNRELFDHPVSNSMRSGVPSEAETLIAYSNSLRSTSMDLGSIMDAVFLDETEPPLSTGKGTKKSSKASGKGMTATPTDPNTLTSFFELQLSTTNASPTESEVERALDLFVRSYNDLKGGFNDPFERTMVEAQLESMTMVQSRTMTIPTNRRRDDVHHPHRELQNLNVLLFLRVSGTCNGCQSNPFFTNQVVGRKRQRRRELFDHPISSMRSGVPSAAETLNAYSLRLQAEDLGSIIDATSLAEMAALPTMSGKGTKKSGKGTGFSEDGGINIVGNILTSFFEIELQTLGGNPTDSEIQSAVDAIVETYNRLTTESFLDPLERQMTSAVVESRGRRRRTQSSRNLQNLNVLLFLRVSGTCLGCSNNAFFTNQVVGRRRQLFDKNLSEDLQEGVPTEAEVLEMYSDHITSGNFGSIVDAIGLDEVEALPAGKGSKKSSGRVTTSMRRNSPMTQAATLAREAPLDVSLSAVTASYPVVQVKMSAQEDNHCMSYTPGSDMIKVETCSSDDSTTDRNDIWEVISGWNGAFKLRHKSSQLCLPQDPDAPGDEFSCFASTGSDGEAMAHRIRGLFDCSSPNVATVGFSDTYNPTTLHLQECASGLSPGKDDDVILMSYVKGEDVVVVWGEKIMLDLEGIVSNRGMQGSWSLQEL
ncbi:MAG: hypothetical protein SGBAC_004353 [Bacillariaceae sp.]